MVEFKCTLSPEAIAPLYGALSCLAKISEIIGLEINNERLMIVALNSTKTTCGAITFSRTSFFQSYHFVGDDSNDNKFRCQLYNKSLLSVFKGRTAGGKDDEAAVERCEILLQDTSEEVDCRLVIEVVSRSGVRKVYKLNYEDNEVMRAIFSKDAAQNRWTIGASMLKAFTVYFAPGAEMLDIYSEMGRATFTSYTERVVRGSEVLKQPLQTSIDIDTLDFVDFQVEDGLHVGINVKDFRAVVLHADTLRTAVTAYYSQSGRPMQMSYSEHGMTCDFTLSTSGHQPGSLVATSSDSRPVRAAGLAAHPTGSLAAQSQSRDKTSRQVSDQPSEMPPPAKPASHKPDARQSTQASVRPPPMAPSASVDEQSLFVNDEEDEHLWNDPDYDAQEDQLGWNGSYASEQMRSLTHRSATGSSRPGSSLVYLKEPEIPPTQPMSDMRGLFD